MGPSAEATGDQDRRLNPPATTRPPNRLEGFKNMRDTTPTLCYLVSPTFQKSFKPTKETFNHLKQKHLEPQPSLRHSNRDGPCTHDVFTTSLDKGGVPRRLCASTWFIRFEDTFILNAHATGVKALRIGIHYSFGLKGPNSSIAQGNALG